MHPILLKIGPITVYSYGVAIASAFLAGISLASRRAGGEGCDPQRITDLCFYILIAAIVGSRVLYIIINLPHYLKNPLAAFKLWQGGLVFYGGLAGAALVAVFYVRKYSLPLRSVADLLAPSLALGQSIGRWGCFFAGCCYGKPTDLPWAVTFTNASSLAPLNIPIHPTQLYSSFANLAIFGLLLYIAGTKRFHGQVFLSYLLLYSVGRFIIEFFRGDDRGFVLGGALSTSQFIGLFVFPLAFFLFYRWRKSAVSSRKLS